MGNNTEHLKQSYILRGISSGSKQRKSFEERVEQFRQSHGDKYNYPTQFIKNSSSKVTVVCREHGEFSVHCHAHISGTGCQECRKQTFKYPKKAKYSEEERRAILKRVSDGNRLSIDDIQNRFFKKYGNKFQYDWADFQGVNKKIRITCSEHGDFFQTPYEHYSPKTIHGCPVCSKATTSYVETQWLNSLGIHNRQYRVQINDKTYILDGYCDETNTAYEYLGDYWHGHPVRTVRHGDVNSRVNKPFAVLFKETEIRFKEMKEFGMNIVYRWESDNNDISFDGVLRY